MWPFDSPYPISYSSSIVTKPLSLTVFEILAPKVPVLCKSILRMRDITWPVPLCKIWVHIWISHPHIAYSLWHFYWSPMKNKGVYSWDPNVKREIEWKFSVPTKIGQILAVRGFKKLRFLPQQARSCVKPRRLSDFSSKSVEGCDLQVGWGKKVRKSQRLPQERHVAVNTGLELPFSLWWHNFVTVGDKWIH